MADLIQKMCIALLSLSGFSFNAFGQARNAEAIPARWLETQQGSQDQSQHLAEFEVATIKPHNYSSGPAVVHSPGVVSNMPGGRVEVWDISLRLALATALKMHLSDVRGGPKWLSVGWNYRDGYDIVGVPPDDSPARQLKSSSYGWLSVEQQQMLLSLLVERCQLKFHYEKKMEPALFLQKNKRRLLIQPATDKSESWAHVIHANHDISIEGRNGSMTQLASSLTEELKIPVVDRTGLTGFYDFYYKYAHTYKYDFDVPGDEKAAMIISSLQAIGLALKKGEAEKDIVVIDRIEKPTPN
jgi:uncharacterized protein (TIGR03435 family)